MDDVFQGEVMNRESILEKPELLLRGSIEVKPKIAVARRFIFDRIPIDFFKAGGRCAPNR
jgi:hypothetical protein